VGAESLPLLQRTPARGAVVLDFQALWSVHWQPRLLSPTLPQEVGLHFCESCDEGGHINM